MTLLAFILTAIGAGDVVRALLPRRAASWVGTVLIVVIAGGLLALAVTFAAAHWVLVLVAAVAVGLWFGSVRVPLPRQSASATRAASHPAGLVLSIALIGVVTITAELTTGTATPLVEQNFGAQLRASSALLILGLVLFLTVSSNALVRAALDRDASGGSQTTPILASPQLKGGRWIGPLERLTLAGLLITGAYPVAAGVIAAKGIVRFPEIQADSKDGNKAEYFLVGSFVSWTLAIGAAGIMRIALA